jgi:predicted DCC family thiol-disulfide oxidoreductase YuxK
VATLVFDGDCGFCTRCVALVPRSARRTTTVVPYQRADLDALGLTVQECAAAVQWVSDGSRAQGHAAIGRLLQEAGGAWRFLGTALLVPPLSWLAALVYRLVAANRMRLPGGTPACALPPTTLPTPPKDL